MAGEIELKVGDEVLYNLEKAVVQKVERGGERVTLKVRDLVVITDPGLDPRFGVKTEAQLSKRFTSLHKALHGE